MFEKVNPCHPDKVADRIAGALVDIAYTLGTRPRIAVEVLLGHGKCFIIAETSVSINYDSVCSVVHRIAGPLEVEYREVPQDPALASNQSSGLRCGDNGIFKGCPVTAEQKKRKRGFATSTIITSLVGTFGNEELPDQFSVAINMIKFFNKY